jgi:Domain of unknown function (DUF4386)
MFMSTTVLVERIAEASPALKARWAGVLYLVAVLMAASGESFLRDRLSIAAGQFAVASFVVVTLILYDMFALVNRNLSWFAAAFGLAGLTLEALRWNPGGVDIAMGCHGISCLLFGYLAFKSSLLPRILGVLMALAGLAWLPFLSPTLANNLSPYNVVAGFVGEASLMLWLLIMGIRVAPWKQTITTHESTQRQRGSRALHPEAIIRVAGRAA